MWNRQQEQEKDTEAPQTDPKPAVETTPSPRAQPTQTAVLGPSITIKGTLSGDEDLLIEGRVDGEVSFQKHTVTVGKSGRIKADLQCKNIYVEGQVHGNLYGEEVVVIKSSGKVNGNAVAPRVSLDDGCHFHGSIDMQPKTKTEAVDSASRKSDSRRQSAPNRTDGDKQQPETKTVSARQSA